MTFPLDLVLVVLIAELYRAAELSGTGYMHAYLGTAAAWGIHVAAIAVLSMAIVWYVEYEAHKAGQEAAHRLFRVLRLAYRALFVAWFGFFLYLSGWWETLSSEWGIPAWAVVDDLLLILPYLAAMMVWHLGTFRLGKVLWGREWGRVEHFLFHERQEILPVLAPWLLLRFVIDALEAYAPRLPGGLQDWVVQAAVGVAFIGLIVLFPEWIRFVLDCRRLPEGALRMRLEALADRAAVGIKDFLVWRTRGARVASAVLVGAVGWTRYCIVSDTLMETLEPGEVEAVAAHELGHVKGHHIGMYLLVVLMFLGGVIGLFGLLPVDVASNYFFATPVLVLLTLIFWRGFFALLSRAAEDEADLIGADLMKDPSPLVSALLKVAALAGGTARVRSWRHRSVEERVKNLDRLGRDPAYLERYGHRMSLLRVVLIVFSILVAAGGLFMAYPRLWESQSMVDRLRAAARRDRENPDAWYALGRQYAKGGRFEDAFRAFIAALEADPGMEEVRSALDGLPLPVAVVAAAEARVFVRTGRYRDALAVLDRAAAQGEAESISALKGYLMAVPGPPSSPNQFYQPDEARKIAQSLGPETRSTLSGYLLRLQIMRLEGNEAGMKELLSGVPAELGSEPEIRGYTELVGGN